MNVRNIGGAVAERLRQKINENQTSSQVRSRPEAIFKKIYFKKQSGETWCSGGCGSVGRMAASDIRDLRFES